MSFVLELLTLFILGGVIVGGFVLSFFTGELSLLFVLLLQVKNSRSGTIKRHVGTVDKRLV
jgi:hypothetical protein